MHMRIGILYTNLLQEFYKHMEIQSGGFEIDCLQQVIFGANLTAHMVEIPVTYYTDCYKYNRNPVILCFLQLKSYNIAFKKILIDNLFSF